jgi:hypothetical protein
LERYEPTFRENEVDADLLPELTEADLVTLGLPFGPRKKLLKAIAALRDGAVPSSVPCQGRAGVAARRRTSSLSRSMGDAQFF